MIKFSIVIATYNRAELLPRALESIINQSFKDWEIIIVDDGSTDATPQVVSEFLSQKLPISYIQQENMGVAMARNKGVFKAKAEYITFLDSDDWYEPHHLETRNEILSKDLTLDLLHGGIRLIGNPFVPDINNLEKKIHLSKCFIGATMFVRRAQIQQMKGFIKLPLGADAEFFERAKNKGISIKKTEIPTYIYDRTGEHSITLDFD